MSLSAKVREEVREAHQNAQDFAVDGAVLELERRPRRGNPTSKPPGAAHEGRRRPRVLRAEERQQKDSGASPEGCRSPLEPPEEAGRREKLRATDYGHSGLVFTTGKDTPLDAQNIINSHFKPLLRRAGLPSIRWHDLRHTYASLLLARARNVRPSGRGSTELRIYGVLGSSPRRGSEKCAQPVLIKLTL